MSTSIKTDVVMLRLREVMVATGLARSTIYKMMREGAFPLPIKLSLRAVAWRSDDLNNWIHDRSSATTNRILRGA